MLREEEQGQEPCRQHQLGGGEDRPCSERGLMVAVATLQQPARAQPHRRFRMSAVRADEPLRPAPKLQRIGARRVGAELLQDALQGQTFLELDRDIRHGVVCGGLGDSMRPAEAQQPSLLMFVNNQVRACSIQPRFVGARPARSMQ